jgi:hypothetical protein
MTFKHPAALVAAGRISESPLRRLTSLTAQIGPVLAATPGLATKFTRSLKAGFPARSREDVADCHIFLVHAPGADIDLPLSLLESLDISWKGKVVVLLDDEHDSTALSRFAAHGAAAGSFSLVPGLEENLALLEGHPAAVRAMRALCRPSQLTALVLEEKAKMRFVAAHLAVDLLFPPLAEATTSSLEHAGIPRSVALRIVFRWLDRRLRGYQAGGRRAWSNRIAPGRRERILQSLQAVRSADPPLADFLVASLRNGLHQMGEEVSWLDHAQAASR